LGKYYPDPIQVVSLMMDGRMEILGIDWSTRRAAYCSRPATADRPLPPPSRSQPQIRFSRSPATFTGTGLSGSVIPGVIRNSLILTAANLHKSWIGIDAEALVAETTGCGPVHFINDADAAGLAEMAFGAGRGLKGVVLVVTIGTGIGTALFSDGCLLPNCEFGHMMIDGIEAEWFASDAARKRERLGWKKWARRFDKFLRVMEKLVWPDLIILGGGISKFHEKFLPELTVQTEVVPAQMLNEAGIIGAALAASSINRLHPGPA
jgi:polyphosphate glucokinase